MIAPLIRIIVVAVVGLSVIQNNARSSLDRKHREDEPTIEKPRVPLPKAKPYPDSVYDRFPQFKDPR